MAFVTVQGSNGAWEYDNAATAADTYADTPGVIAAGVRTFTKPAGGTQKTYIKCRQTGKTAIAGEINKDFYDYRFSQGTP
jgi:hypothetical protein